MGVPAFEKGSAVVRLMCESGLLVRAGPRPGGMGPVMIVLGG